MKILVIAPHPDDEILGVGGTMAKYVEQGNDVYVCVMTKGAPQLCDEEYRKRARKECLEAHIFLGVKQSFFLDFPAAMIETVPRYEMNSALLDVVRTVQPDEVYIPHRGDMQLDHKLTADAAMVVLRPKYPFAPERIYAYEALSETGWDIPNTVNEFIPTVYNDITGFMEKKLKAMEKHQLQIAEYPNPRSAEAIEALGKYRGSTVCCTYAEAFQLIREIRREAWQRQSII